MRIHIFTENIYFSGGAVAFLEEKGYVVNVVSPYNKRYLDDLNLSDLVIFHFYKLTPSLNLQVLNLSGKLKLLLVSSSNLKLGVICNINKSIDERASLEQLFHAVSKTISSDIYYQEQYNKLSERERIVLIDTLHGTKVFVTAKQLKLSEKTVYAHKINAFRKLGVRNIQDIMPLKDLILERNRQVVLKYTTANSIGFAE